PPPLQLVREPQELVSMQSRLVTHAHARLTQWGPGPQADWQFWHWPPVLPHWLATVPCTHWPPVAMFLQPPPLQPVLLPPQSCSHECRGIEQALSAWQSVAALQPHTPATHALFEAWPAQFVQAPPLVPQAAPAVPVTQVPALQQPPL